MSPQFENNVPAVNNQAPINSPSKHGRLILLTIVLILVGILAVGYFLYQNTVFVDKRPQILSIEEIKNGVQCSDDVICPIDYKCVKIDNLPGAQGTCTATQETNEFADWKTYRNKEYGFEFKYFDPNNDIFLDPKSEPGNFLFTSKKLMEKLPYGTDSSPVVHRLEIYTTKYKTPIEWLSNENDPYRPRYKDRMSMLTISTSTVSGVPALKVFDPISDGSCLSDFALFINNGYAYKVLCYQDEDQILSTFKFIPSTSSGQVSTSTPTNSL